MHLVLSDEVPLASMLSLDFFASYSVGQKTEAFFLKIESKPTDLGHCETVTTLDNMLANFV